MISSDIILNHALVPKHEILSKNDADELMKKLGITKEQFPKINRTDPTVEAIGAKKGDIIKIARDSLITGKAVSYRIVN